MSGAPAILLIFDFDNTLVDSRINFPELRATLTDMLARAGPLPAAREALLRLPILDLVECGRQRSPALAAAMWAAIETFEAEGLKDATAMPHAHRVLAGLAARAYRLALLTNNARPATVRILDALDLTQHFDLVVTRDDVPRLKPDPVGVRYIIDRLGPVRTAFLVGDSWIDGLTARAAGIRFVGFGPRRGDAEARGITAWAWVAELPELLDLDWES
ncbi:MAG: HAD-IA family hydrolase [Armatimonadota bacterium]|nr:HAD-IA family hydrolase [Armatimonadota bacterium]